MRRTVWGALLALLVLAAVMQSVKLVERPRYDEWDARIQADGRVVKARGVSSRPTAESANRKRPSSTGRNGKLTAEERQAIHWKGSVKSAPRAKIDPDATFNDAAYRDALDKAQMLLTRELQLPSIPSRDFIRRYVETKATTSDGPADDTIGQTQIVELDLELNGESLQQLARVQRDDRVKDRAEGMIRLTAMVTGILACLAGYIRLDDYTKGYYTGRLRILAIAVAFFVSVGAINVG